MPVKKTTAAETVEAAETKTVKKTAKSAAKPKAVAEAKKAAALTADEDKPVKKTTAKPKAVKETEKKEAAKTTKKVTRKAAVKTDEEKSDNKLIVRPKSEVALKTPAEVAVRPAAEVAVVEQPAQEVKEEAPAKKTRKKAEPKAKKTTAKKTARKAKSANVTEKELVEAAPKAELEKDMEVAAAAAAKEAPAEVEILATEKELVEAAPKAELEKDAEVAAAAAKEAPAEAEILATEKELVEAAPKAELEKDAEVAAAAAEEPALEAQEQPEAKKEAPAEEKKPFLELTDEKIAGYKDFDLGTLTEMAKALGLNKDLEALKADLEITPDILAYTEDILNNQIAKDHGYVYEDDGFDETVIPVLIEKVLATLPVKASDHADLAKEIEANYDFVLTSDPIANANEYNILFDLVKRILMMGQKRNIHTITEIEKTVPTDIRKLVTTFMKTAYDLLPTWQYNDVKYYEGFLYSVLSQFEDLSDLQNQAMMDVADLYIKHGDYGRGDAEYNYIIRENQLKDYIFYRFANVYMPIDRQKAKAIASGALRYVDGRYTYYPNIIEILNS